MGYGSGSRARIAAVLVTVACAASPEADDATADSDGSTAATTDPGETTGGADTGSSDLLVEGVWSLIGYDLGNGLAEPVPATIKDAFLLSFSTEDAIVTVASCGVPGADTPEDSICRLSLSMTSWQCRCYAYAMQDEQMQWREFEAGQMPPDVVFDAESPGSDTIVQLSLDPDTSTMQLQALPAGVFGADAATDEFHFVERALSVFNEVYTDPEGACLPCAP